MSSRPPTATGSVPGKHCKGFSFLELVLVVTIIGTLIGIAATRLFPYVAEAERVAVERIEGQLRNVLTMEVALWIARGDTARLAELDAVNPMDLTLEPPSTYLGELEAPSPATLPQRSWHFDTQSRRLVYRAGSALETGNGPLLYEYSVRLHYRDRNGDARYTPGADDFHGLRLRRIETESGA